jgi:hypothetical protein
MTDIVTRPCQPNHLGSLRQIAEANEYLKLSSHNKTQEAAT